MKILFRLAACSRCYRAELPGGKSEGSLYRVHEFTKVEMFAVTTDDDKVSQDMLDEIVRVQTSLFEELGLHFRFDPFRYFIQIELFLEFWICPRKNWDYQPIENMILKHGCQRKDFTEKYVGILHTVSRYPPRMNRSAVHRIVRIFNHVVFTSSISMMMGKNDLFIRYVR